jgi:hypothetical protein
VSTTGAVQAGGWAGLPGKDSCLKLHLLLLLLLLLLLVWLLL